MRGTKRRRTCDRRVGNNQAVDPTGERDGDDVVEFAFLEVRRDLDEERPARRNRLARFDDPRDERVERLAALQIAQAWRVGRGHVDRQVVGDRREGFDSEHVVGDAVGGVLVGPDIDADEARGPSREPGLRLVVAVIVEAEAVDDRRVFAQAEEPRTGVPGLRARRQRADLDETEAERSIAPGTSAFLSNPAARPSGFGK